MTAAASPPDTRLDPRLTAILAEVEVSPDGRHATVAGRSLDADTPRKLRQELVTALYETFHVGHAFGAGNDEGRPLREPAFERRLAECTPHTETLVAAQPREHGASPAAVAGAATAAVAGAATAAAARIAVVDGLRVRLGDAVEQVGDTVRLPARRPGLSPGFFLVDGSRGRPSGGPLLRLYQHVDHPDEAVGLWTRTLRTLEDAGVRYRAKVTSAQWLLPRRDGLVVYLGADAWDVVPALTEGVQPAEKAGRPDLSSSFARVLAPGVSLAWEPDDRRPGRRGLSFGQHRAAAVAEALLDGTGGASLPARLREARVDPSAIHRNIDSPNIARIGECGPRHADEFG
ncbi:T3SS effector HopA1 family protein [Streptomyces sp. NPDC002888]|uniref:T3SS effector HopA1 family protein n=1 Tax=Streptomyces sp. NPDC002888 TaxID=3364668 RepID=UPI00369C1877